MFRRLTRTVVLTLTAVIGTSGVLAGAIDGWTVSTLGRGASVGALVGIALALHLAARTLARRTPEAAGAEFHDGSVERAAIKEAAAPTFFDVMSMGILASVAGVLAPGTAPFLAPLVTCFAVTDFVLRALRRRKELMPRG